VGDRAGARQIARPRVDDRGARRRRDPDGERAAGTREEKLLEEGFRDQPGPRRPERRPYRDLTKPTGCSRE
jgi:hypothetical protein